MSPLYLEYMMRENAHEREQLRQKIHGTERVRRGAASRLSRPPGGLRRNLARRLVSLGLYLDPWAR
jgi:hypothetical protein